MILLKDTLIQDNKILIMIMLKDIPLQDIKQDIKQSFYSYPKRYFIARH